jgi:large subunit ribosomal protein L22
MAEAHDVRAVARYVPVSAQKTRLVVDMIRGWAANEALETLRFTPNAGAASVAKVLRSAMANAEENFGLSRDDLVIHTAFADEAPVRRWRRFGARGRFKPIRRGTCHITIVLREREQSPAQAG